MVTLGVVGAFSKFVVSGMNRATCSNYDTLLHHMTERERPQGLITVSNHSSTFDDPGVLSYLIPWWYFATEPRHEGVRWTMCTKEICAASPAVHKVLHRGQDRSGQPRRRTQPALVARDERPARARGLAPPVPGGAGEQKRERAGPPEVGPREDGLRRRRFGRPAADGPAVLALGDGAREEIRALGLLALQPRARHRGRARRPRRPRAERCGRCDTERKKNFCTPPSRRASRRRCARREKRTWRRGTGRETND